MKRWLGGALAAVAVLLGARDASAEQWLGLFEGHGIAPPAEAKRARAAVVAARRAVVECYDLYSPRTGGTLAAGRACRDGVRALDKMRGDALAATFDVLDLPRMGFDSFEMLLAIVGSTERADGVPVLVTAIERMAARSGVEDPEIHNQGRRHLDTIHRILVSLTYADPVGKEDLGGNIWQAASDEAVAACAKAWRAWLGAHPTIDRDAWKREAIRRARAAVAGSDHKAAAAGALRLASFRETMKEGIEALKALPKRPSWPAENPPINVEAELKQIRPRRR